MTGSAVDILVVGAGPTGLALALQAVSLGAGVRIVERRAEVFRPSRAIIVHPRTLEVLRPLGVCDALLDHGRRAPRVDLHLGGRIVPTRLGEFAVADTPYPFLLFERQAVVERVLVDALGARGVEVERGVELIGLHRVAEGVACSLRHATGNTDTVSARYVVGCDGQQSVVRRQTGARWRGGRYRHEIVLADVELETALTPEVGHMAPGRAGLVFLLAMEEQATWRVLASRPHDRGADPERRVPPVELQGLLDGVSLDATVREVAWSARIPIQHRMASRYRKGAVFVAGDAAHTHSPAGGQGMNTGIQDALNLGWKLAFAASRPASGNVGGLLDSYELERRPVARRVLAMTRLLYWVEAGTDPVARFARTGLGPLAAPLVPFALARRRPVAEGVRSLSQLRVHYRRSPLSQGAQRLGRGRPRPGDRLPDRALAGAGPSTLHGSIATPGVHVLLERDAGALDGGVLGPSTHLHRIADWPGAGVIVVRPDGYVGYVSNRVEVDEIVGWLTSICALPA